MLGDLSSDLRDPEILIQATQRGVHRRLMFSATDAPIIDSGAVGLGRTARADDQYLRIVISFSALLQR